MLRALALTSAALAIGLSAPAAATEKRCGWLHNPTPANWWLDDRHGQWIIGVQGGYQAPGMDKMPDMTTRGWIRTNGYYGYGCACMTVETDRRNQLITRITSASPQPIRQCRSDRRLPKP
jgi:hypothetical protein